MPLNPNASAFNPDAPKFVPTFGQAPNAAAAFPALASPTPLPAAAPAVAPRGAWGSGAPRGAWGSGPPAVAVEPKKDSLPPQPPADGKEAAQKENASRAAVPPVEQDDNSNPAIEMEEAGKAKQPDASMEEAGKEKQPDALACLASDTTPSAHNSASVPKSTDTVVVNIGQSADAVKEAPQPEELPAAAAGKESCSAEEHEEEAAAASSAQWHQDPAPELSRNISGTAARLQPKIQRETSVAPPNKTVDAAILRWESVEDLHAAATMALAARTETAFDTLPSVVTWLRPCKRRPGASGGASMRQLTLDIPEAGVVHDPKLEDFELLRLVGRGGFGKVYQVRKKKSGRIMALKAMRKHLIVEELNVEGTHNERSVLESVQHPFVIRLHCAFHDHGRLYLLMDWHNGGHLLKLLHEHAPFMEKEVRFYMAELVLAIEGLHSRGIVHRDLKPENVLLDSMGHLIVTDFGASKISSKANEDIRTNSWVGTVLYMAPEQLQGKVYGRVVDWWAVGLLCWEMLTGDNPFYHENPDQIAVRVQKKKLNLPSHFHGDTHAILKAMLNRDPEKRLGKKGTAEVKDHAFFSKAKNFSWKDAHDKKHAPPFRVPGLQENPDDVSQVDDNYTSMPAVMSPIDPGLLSPRAQEQFKGFEWVSPLYSPAVNRMAVPDLVPTQLDLSAPADVIEEEDSSAAELAPTQAADAEIQRVADAMCTATQGARDAEGGAAAAAEEARPLPAEPAEEAPREAPATAAAGAGEGGAAAASAQAQGGLSRASAWSRPPTLAASAGGGAGGESCAGEPR